MDQVLFRACDQRQGTEEIFFYLLIHPTHLSMQRMSVEVYHTKISMEQQSIVIIFIERLYRPTLVSFAQYLNDETPETGVNIWLLSCLRLPGNWYQHFEKF